ncbi:hypothetical protein Trichorick_01808 (plasmid) [Candidatus Trichorickettsia mobilis]|jgi:hypothetical protein|uniref:hypothetical protein n=1 Tax=Candidatus Trichorickettsia mobilis TaxID=1346319 RepID=UPI002B257E48|nr:hypothetical protein [Candidatus Trichorickettsia mobilis]WPY01885.1 hypothetical protein Trichorick_01808 [Candidatus Trichorickettsia mobilis]
MTNKEIRLHCAELALKYLSNDNHKNVELNHIFEIAEKIYEFTYKNNDDIIGHSDEVNWEAYKDKLRNNNRKVRIKI